jgi:hypothetical protein
MDHTNNRIQYLQSVQPVPIFLIQIVLLIFILTLALNPTLAETYNGRQWMVGTKQALYMYFLYCAC